MISTNGENKVLDKVHTYILGKPSHPILFDITIHIKRMEIYFKFMWPSQNIWTLENNKSKSAERGSKL